MEIKEVIEILSTTLIWEVISEKVENLNQLPIMLGDSRYIENKDTTISQITRCEVLDSESLEIIGFTNYDESIFVVFEMPFVLSAWNESKQLLRITATVTGKYSVPDSKKYDWDNIDFENMGKKELLEYKELVDILEINYQFVECDDISVL